MKKVLLTGAAGGMGYESLRQMAEDGCDYEIVVCDLPNDKSKERLREFEGNKRVTIMLGDLTNYRFVVEAVRGCDLIIHIAAFVSPTADYFPKKAMEVNYGSTKNFVNALYELGQQDATKYVSIGTVAETGDRMPPIHWGRVGDPIKPSMYDYYAVSKVAAERLVVESGLKYWVSLRQTGIMGTAMAKIRDSIQFHNCLDNVLEYVSDRDSGRAMRNLAAFDNDGSLSEDFWGHIYNIGGGEECRVVTIDMYKIMYGEMGFTSLDSVIEPKYNATRNFHGQYYLDSDKLEDYLHFRSDSMQYFYAAYLKEVGAAKPFAQVINKLPGGQKFMGWIIRQTFKKYQLGEHGTRRWINENDEACIDAYWGSKKAWEKLPEKVSDVDGFKDWDTVVAIDHGYDETKPESELTLEDMKGAAEFRGGTCDSTEMTTGDWKTPLKFTCQYGHHFTGSPRLILEGGHWCDECERKSWNYGNRAKKDKFFAQVWNPLHDEDELREYPKIVNELEV
ncbi:Nucleoside-diphosphate-sugar epimerase [Pseudobutyrivibrio sp. 49]|uniref:NAD-dependent epimerase/dehydratase family protein n=1 Tax=Pseudobutyrivibrio sp. 49 TaxID=1855344 RepID=UPI0008853B2C|nr:NAD(P)-dependent oxidoreductase [Pseudobutyrivibrio sp. 49]SDH82587.1 Nucleoside-diphosphate-sugar epimerase [Pseudobutyrivibrio sp. 49]